MAGAVVGAIGGATGTGTRVGGGMGTGVGAGNTGAGGGTGTTGALTGNEVPPLGQQLSPAYPLPASKQLRWQTLVSTQFACLLHFLSIWSGKSSQPKFFFAIMRTGSFEQGVQFSFAEPQPSLVKPSSSSITSSGFRIAAAVGGMIGRGTTGPNVGLGAGTGVGGALVGTIAGSTTGTTGARVGGGMGTGVGAGSTGAGGGSDGTSFPKVPSGQQLSPE